MVELRVYDQAGKADSLQLDLGIEQKEMSPRTYYCGIRGLLQNWRQGTVGC